jgi:hypothetical protein
MTKKRTSLDTILTRAVEPEKAAAVPADPRLPAKPEEGPGGRPGVKQQTAYLAIPIYEQLRRLAFEERAKMHDYLIEGLDLVFRKRGLPSVEELKGRGE